MKETSATLHYENHCCIECGFSDSEYIYLYKICRHKKNPTYIKLKHTVGRGGVGYLPLSKMLYRNTVLIKEQQQLLISLFSTGEACSVPELRWSSHSEWLPEVCSVRGARQHVCRGEFGFN